MTTAARAAGKAARTLATAATAIAVCVAVLYWTGRAVAWQLPQLESMANRLLASREIGVAGLEGRWRGLNPGLFAARLTLPSGHVEGLDLELDVLESLRRRQFVASRLTVADGRLRLKKTAAGWQLPTGGDFDAAAFFRYSDGVWVRGQLRLEDGPRADTVDVEAMVVNHDRQHRFFFYLHSGSGCAACALTLAGDINETGHGAVRLASDRFAVSQPLLSVLGLTQGAPSSPWRNMHWELDLDGHWVRHGPGSERARLAADLRILGTTGAAGTATARLTAWQLADGDGAPDGDRDLTGYGGRIEALTLASGDRTSTTTGAFTIDGLGGPRWAATAWFPALRLAPLLEPIAHMMGERHPSGRWLSAVAPQGRISDLALRFDADGVAIQGRGAEGALTGYKGVPSVDGLTFALRGHGRALRLAVAGRDFGVAFPGHIPAVGPYQRGGATLTFVFARPYIGMRTADAWLATPRHRMDVALAVARPPDPTEVRVAADGSVDRLPIATGHGYLPERLAPALREWLLAATGDGELEAGRIVYRGHARSRGALPMRRLEIAATLRDASLDYHPDWPPASHFNGSLEVTGEETRLAGRARAFDIDLDAVAVRVPRQAERVAVQMRGGTDLARLFAFARQTPVRDSLTFLADAWSGRGDVRFKADLKVPFGGAALRPGDIRLDLALADTTLDLPDLGLLFEGLHKDVTFAYPATLAGASSGGSLFGTPVEVAIASDADTMRFSLSGSAATADVYRMLGIEDLGIASGGFDFDAALTIFTTSDRAPELHLTSELVGLAVTLPAPLGKAASEPRPLETLLQFLNERPGQAASASRDTVAVSARYGDTSGWLHVGDGIDGGAVGVGAPVPMVDATAGRVVLGGGVGTVTAAELEALGQGAAAGADWELRDFRVGQLALDKLTFGPLTVDAHAVGSEVAVRVDGADLRAAATRQGDEPWQLDIERLLLPAAASEADPLRADLLGRLVAADVVIRQVAAGDEDYGNWRFRLRPEGDGVAILDLVADVRGLHIESTGETERTFWSPAGTRFQGRVTAGNLQHVLPQWGFAESVVSERFSAAGDLRWPGSPLNFDLAHLTGQARLELAKGSFLDVAPSGTRIMSLINFSTIVKRLSLDFSDVFGRGVAFERVLAELAVDDGLATFAKPGEVIGTGSTFLVTGTVDLDAGDLNNELVVTLPLLTGNLPWYAAFLAFSNPAGAAGVWLGRQVFKDQLRRLSSGKYRIGGTYDEPQVEFVSIFDNDIDLAPGTAATSP